MAYPGPYAFSDPMMTAFNAASMGPPSYLAGSGGGGGMDLSWLSGFMGPGGGFGTGMNALGGIGSLLGGQNFQQGGFMGLGGGGFGGLSGMDIPDEFTYTQDSDLSRRMKRFLERMYGGWDAGPHTPGSGGLWAHEMDMQGGQLDALRYLQDSMERLGMGDIDLRRELGLGGLDVSREQLASQERLGFGGQDLERALGMRGFESQDTRSQMLANALMGIFGGGMSGMTQAPAGGGTGQAGMPQSGLMGGGATPSTGLTNAPQDYFSNAENLLMQEYNKPQSLAAKDYAGMASRGNQVIDKQAQEASASANRNAQRSGLGFDTGLMNQQARIGADARGDFSNRMADAEYQDKMQRAQMRPGLISGLAGIGGQRQQGRQFMQNQLMPYLGMI